MFVLVPLEILLTFIVYYFKCYSVLLLCSLFYIFQYIIIYDYCEEKNETQCYPNNLFMNSLYIIILFVLVYEIYHLKINGQTQVSHYGRFNSKIKI